MIRNTNLKERIIAFDLLRVGMLFLLIVIHSGMSFMQSELNPEIWLFKDSNTHIAFDGVVSFIHTFRLPIFFIVSGFLTHQMFFKHSPKQVFVKRFKRLFLPLVFTIVFIGPFVHVLLAALAEVPDLHTIDTTNPPDQNTIFGISTIYVWFIYYLFIFSVIHIVAVQLGLGEFLTSIKLTKQWFLVIILFILLFVMGFLALWKENLLFGQYGLFPEIGSLGGYFMFYIFGIFLAKNLKGIELLKSNGFTFFILGSLFFVAFSFLSMSIIEQKNNIVEFDYQLMITGIMASGFYTFGFIGLALKYYTKPISIVTYVSRSSYFLYLIHFPIMLLILNLLVTHNWNVFFKFSMVLFLTTISSLLVNSIWIRLWKNHPPI